jgi:hypothetical protein
MSNGETPRNLVDEIQDEICVRIKYHDELAVACQKDGDGEGQRKHSEIADVLNELQEWINTNC